MFNQLYKLDTQVESSRESDDVWAIGAKGDEQSVMLTYYNNDDNAPEKDVKVTFKNVDNKNGVRLEYYLLDADHDCALVREEIFTASEFSSYVKMNNFTTYLLKAVSL